MHARRATMGALDVPSRLLKAPSSCSAFSKALAVRATDCTAIVPILFWAQNCQKKPLESAQTHDPCSGMMHKIPTSTCIRYIFSSSHNEHLMWERYAVRGDGLTPPGWKYTFPIPGQRPARLSLWNAQKHLSLDKRKFIRNSKWGLFAYTSYTITSNTPVFSVEPNEC